VRVLALDVGSSSVKAAVWRSGLVAAGPVRTRYPTRYAGVRVEIDPAELLRAVHEAAAALGDEVRGVDVVSLTTLGPAFVALDAAGEPLTPLVTHADRRSVAEAQELERRVGRARHLRLAGNRPYPGGIASTTWAWFNTHAPELMARAATVGSATTYLLSRLTGARVVDPSHASFLGVYRTLTLDGWEPELVAAVGGRPEQLPEVREASAVAGRLVGDGLGAPAGTPVLTGCVDGSAAMLAAGVAAGGLRPGQLVNTVGSTDVLAMCVATPAPAEGLLTRALGVGRRWLTVATLASAGSTLDWAHRTFFADTPPQAYWELVAATAAAPDPGEVRFAPYLAGDRTAVEQRRAALTGLTLGARREQILSAVVEGLAEVSASRLPRLAAVAPALPTVYVTGGGAAGPLGSLLRRDWPAGWRYEPMVEATLTGAATLATGSNQTGGA
jgi:xylulokinase